MSDEDRDEARASVTPSPPPQPFPTVRGYDSETGPHAVTHGAYPGSTKLLGGLPHEPEKNWGATVFTWCGCAVETLAGLIVKGTTQKPDCSRCLRTTTWAAISSCGEDFETVQATWQARRKKRTLQELLVDFNFGPERRAAERAVRSGRREA